MLDKDFAGRFREELVTRHIVFDEDEGEFTVSPGSLVSDEDGFVCIFEALAAEKGDIFQLEGFQVHSRYVGSVGEPLFIGSLKDSDPPLLAAHHTDDPVCSFGYVIYYNDDLWHLAGFTSIGKYSGFFQIYETGLMRIMLDTENVSMHPDESDRETLVFLQAKSTSDLMGEFAEMIERHHGRIPDGSFTGCRLPYSAGKPEGGSSVSGASAAGEMKSRLGSFRFVELGEPDGNEPGSWIMEHGYLSGIESMAKEIAGAGAVPAFRCSPLAVSMKSAVAMLHSDWLVKSLIDPGTPFEIDNVALAGTDVPAAGILDFSNPEVCEAVAGVFRTLHERLGIGYFRLESLSLACARGGASVNGSFTRIDNYRKGLETIEKAVSGAVVELCDAPLWPSLGLGSVLSVSDSGSLHEDLLRRARLLAQRRWMDGNLWLIDAGPLTFSGPSAPEDEGDRSFAAALALVFRSVLFFTDSPSELRDEDIRILEKIREAALAHYNTSAIDEMSRCIKLENDDRVINVYFNWSESRPLRIRILPDTRNFWTDEPLEADSYVTVEGFGAFVTVRDVHA